MAGAQGTLRVAARCEEAVNVALGRPGAQCGGYWYGRRRHHLEMMRTIEIEEEEQHPTAHETAALLPCSLRPSKASVIVGVRVLWSEVCVCGMRYGSRTACGSRAGDASVARTAAFAPNSVAGRAHHSASLSRGNECCYPSPVSIVTLRCSRGCRCCRS